MDLNSTDAHRLSSFREHLLSDRGSAASTVDRYSAVVRRFLKWMSTEPGLAAASDPVLRVGKPELLSFLRRGEVPPSASVWNNRIAAMRSFYSFLVESAGIPLDPTTGIRRRRVPVREREPLSFEEGIRLLDSVGEHSHARLCLRDAAIVTLMIHCALRVREVVSLNIGQVDLENRILREVRTKGGKRLSVYLNNVAVEAIGEHLATHPAASNTSPLFLSSRRTRLTVRTVEIMVSTRARQAGIRRHVSPHLLRHSCVTRLVEVGTPLPVIQEICGHSDISTTRRYVTLSGVERKGATDELAAEWRRRAHRVSASA